MKKREERRHYTYWKCFHRHRTLVRDWFHRELPWGIKAPRIARDAHRTAKRTLECGCRGRKHGAPKNGAGPCRAGERPSWRERKAGRELVREWAAWEGPLDDCEA